MAAYEILVIVAGLVVGWIRKGSLWSITSLRLNYLWVLPVAYLLQHFSIDDFHGILYEISIVLSYIGLIVFCLLNYTVPGLLWALVGTASNFLVMLVNGLRMPAYLVVIQSIDPKMASMLKAGRFGKSIAMSSHTHLNFLGDIFPFRIWPQSMISVGDVLFGIGFVLLIQYAMNLPRKESQHDQTQSGDATVPSP